MKEQLDRLKKEAQDYCRQVRLDDAIRTLCKGQGSKGDDINRSLGIPLPNGKTLDLRATWGAGCNGAYARYADSTHTTYFHLYECTNYGQHLSAFQMGAWVEFVLKLAGQEALARQAHDRVAEMRQLQDQLRKWMPVDDLANY